MYFVKRIKTSTTKNVPLTVGTKVSAIWGFGESVLSPSYAELELIYVSDKQCIFLDTNSNNGVTFSISMGTGRVIHSASRDVIFAAVKAGTSEKVIVHDGKLCTVSCESEEKVQYTKIKVGDEVTTRHRWHGCTTTATVLFVSFEFIIVQSEGTPFAFERKQVLDGMYTHATVDRACKIETDIFCGLPPEHSIVK